MFESVGSTVTLNTGIASTLIQLAPASCERQMLLPRSAK
jgi:hypothetical protein